MCADGVPRNVWVFGGRWGWGKKNDGEEKNGFLFLPKQSFHPIRRLSHVRRGLRSFSSLTATGGSAGRKATSVAAEDSRVQQGEVAGKNECMLESLPKSASNCICY